MRMLSLIPLLVAGVAVAEEPSFRDGFTPHPFTAEMKVANAGISMYEKGYAKCSSSRTSDAPAYTFTVAEPMKDLQVTLDHLGVVVLPDRSYYCVQATSLALPEWKAGQYKVYLYGEAAELHGGIRIEQPQREQAEVKAALARMPEVALGPGTVPNPLYVTPAPPAPTPARLPGIRCLNGTLVPLARVKIEETAEWIITARNGARLALIRDDDGTCYNDLRSGTIEPGEYALWGEAPAKATSWELRFFDNRRVLAFADAPTYDLGKLEKPVVLAAKSSPAGWGRLHVNACPELPQAPSFYLKGPASLQNVEVKLWRDGGLGKNASFIVYGPMETARAGQNMACNLARLGFSSLEGTFAVFVVGGNAPADISAVARQADAAIDPFTTLAPIPETLAVPERALPRHYPYFSERTNVEKFFLEAPRQLFVSLDQDSGDIAAGEPLLVAAVDGGQVSVVRFDGTVQQVAASHVVGSVPTPAKLPPAAPTPQVAKSIDDAVAFAGVAEAPFVARYQAVEESVNGCVGNWMVKNDPTWGKSYDIVYLSNGETMNQRKFKEADKVCHAERLEAAGKALVGQVNASRTKSAKAYFAALKKRFP